MKKSELKRVPIVACVPSKTNPKGRITGEAFDELVVSIAEKGVLQPILVRAVVANKGAGFHYEIVAGHRRLEAARLTGYSEIPAQVVEMTDAEALESQIIENLHRQDVTPLEEGESYRQLVEQSKQSPEDIAFKVGKTVAYVRGRLVLTNLVPAGKRLLVEGKLGLAVAVIVARVNEKEQPACLKWIKEQWDAPEPAEVREWLQQRSYASLTKAPWNADELRLLVEDCEECPKTKNDLFGKDARGLCPNPKCWARKMAAFVVAKRQADPQIVLLHGGYGQTEKFGEDKDAVWSKSDSHWIEGKKDRCDHVVKGIVVTGEGVGQIVDVCLDKKCEKHSHQVADYAPSPAEKARRKSEQKAAEAAEKKAHVAIGKALGRLTWPMKDRHLDTLLDVALDVRGTMHQQPVCKRRGIKPVATKNAHGGTSRDYEKALRTDAGDSQAGKLRLVFELLGQGWKAGDTAKKLGKL